MADLHVRVLSYNTQGLQGIEKRVDIFEYLKNMRQDIYCLQDTHFIKENEINVIDQWGNNYCIFSNFKSNAHGVAIFFNKDLDYKIHRKIIDENGNFIILDLNVHNQRLSLINLSGPNKDNPDFFKIISNYIDEIGNTNIIICGN